MNKTLNALSLQLTIRINELCHGSQAIELQINAIETQILESQQHILEASVLPEKILPEQEMSRLHYILSQQQHHDELSQLKVDLLLEKSRLESEHLRKNTELKRLEKYQHAHLNKLQQKALLTQYNDMDEWVLLRHTTEGALQ